ncbi:hypothetical protein MFLO_02643 [Listeria floridensis FSL S10-1187]|uniref:Uncharacterized protein n=1 Tax=Listeria floridensis FSL S10-1187 TaxID=1265817 RepID=A0ABP3B0K9_9LIST|nr:hypothetical protein [Listeria floridensis]EUJ33415.1 hypothetical protein MFLO_02643 [Listeria floridensis FSL S10-1187]
MKKWFDLLLGFMGLIAIGILIVSSSHIFAADNPSKSLMLSSNRTEVRANSSFEITVQDKSNSINKVYISTNENFTYQNLKDDSTAKVTNDSINHQLIVEWQSDQEHEATLVFVPSNLGSLTLEAFDETHTISDSISLTVKEENSKVQNLLSRTTDSLFDNITPFINSPYGTTVNIKGQYVAGKPVQKSKEIIPLIHYTTGSIATDLTADGKPVRSPSMNTTFKQGTILKIKNVGYHQGNPCVLVMKILSPTLTLDVYNDFPTRIAAANDPLRLSMEVWLEDINGKAISASGVSVLFPLKIQIGNLRDDKNRNVVTTFSNRSAITNILARDSSLSGAGSSFLDPLGNSYQLVGRAWSNMSYNVLFNASEHLILTVSLMDNNGNVVPLDNPVDILYYHKLFDSSSNAMVIQLPYPPPTVEAVTNEKNI